ncbi:MAG: hypothetical protein JST86_08130 [Bacteroidetes bacterium]|nr:hypothetical protein [Bacteroidota bacterium]
MKKTTAILLLAILALSQGAACLYYALEVTRAKEIARERILQHIPDNLLMKVSEKQAFKNEEDELWYGDQLFDVVKRVDQDGKVYLLCLADKDETLAVLQLANLSQTDNPLNKSNCISTGKLKNFIQDLFNNDNYNQAAFNTAQLNKRVILFPQYDSPLYAVNGNVLVPPPKC